MLQVLCGAWNDCSFETKGIIIGVIIVVIVLLYPLAKMTVRAIPDQDEDESENDEEESEDSQDFDER